MGCEKSEVEIFSAKYHTESGESIDDLITVDDMSLDTAKCKIVDWYVQDVNTFFQDVLRDSEKDPQYSAITCRNRIELFQLYDAQRNLLNSEKSLNYIDFLCNRHSQSEIILFQKKIDSEILRYGKDRPFVES